jgi:hypothetical protein
MSIEIGLFMGLCMWVSFKLGNYFGTRRTQRIVSAMLNKMNEDMDGLVVKWFETQDNVNLIKGGE